MRYFFAKHHEHIAGVFRSGVKDLREGLGGGSKDDQEFLHKYMTLTRCDLLFADKGVLIEGPTERLLLPKMIEKIDEDQSEGAKLGSQYLTVMEVGGAYAHIFYRLIDFLELRTLIITDIDTVDSNNNRKKCKVSEGTHSSNACINNWFSGDKDTDPPKDEIFQKEEKDKIVKYRRLAFEIPHKEGEACGRSFEDAFMLENTELFSIDGETPQEREEQAWQAAKKIDKTDFALKYAINETDWNVPRYIEEGLRWLAQSPIGIFKAEEKTGDSKVEENGDV